MPNKINIKKNKDLFKFLIDISRKKSVNALFNNIKLVFEKDKTIWAATDGEIYYSFSQPATNEELGSQVFSGKILWDLFKQVKSEEITMAKDKSFFHLLDHEGNAYLKLSSQEFDSKNKEDFQLIGEIETQNIKTVIKCGLLPVNEEEDGLLSLILKPNNINFVSRDRRRLSVASLEATYNHDLIITARKVIMSKIMDFADKYATIELYENDSEYLVYQSDEYLIFKKSSPDNFNYSAICNSTNYLEYKCDLTDLRKALDFVSIMCSNLNHTVELIFKDTHLTLQVIDPNQGKCVRRIEGKGEINGSLCVNRQYLLEALLLKNDAEICLYYKSAESKLVLRNGITTHVIMPIVR